MPFHEVPADRLSIPRWTIQRDPVFRHCRRCGSSIVKVTLDARRISFCTCHIVVDELISKRTGP